MKSFKVILTVALAAFIINGAPAYAVDPDPGTYRSKTSGQWDSAGNWEVDDGGWRDADDYPRTGDTATILKSHVIHIISNTDDIHTLTLERGDASNAAAILELRDAGNLNVGSSLTAETDATYPAMVKFVATGAQTRPELRSIAIPATISGMVKATGDKGGVIARTSLNTFTLNSGAEILAAGGDITISAPLEIDGTVRASNVGATGYTVTFSAAPKAASDGLLHVDHANATIAFGNGSARTFTGALDIKLEDGTIDVQDNIELAGGVEFTKGFIKVVNGKQFKKTGSYTH